MNSIKKPETVITLVNTAALLGASIYFYRKINNLELELNKHSEHLTLTVKKVKEIANTKKHIAVLANAIKEVNQNLGTQTRDIGFLKEICKYQNDQISELQSALKSVKEDIEIKLKDNPHIPSITYRQQFPQQFPQQGYPQQLPPQQQLPQQFPQQGGSLIDLNGQRESPTRFPQQFPQQQFPPQGYGQQQFPPQGFAQQQFPQQGYPQQQQFSPQAFSPQQGYPQQQQQTNYSFEEDDDAAIETVRRARQKSNDPLDALF